MMEKINTSCLKSINSIKTKNYDWNKYIKCMKETVE